MYTTPGARSAPGVVYIQAAVFYSSLHIHHQIVHTSHFPVFSSSKPGGVAFGVPMECIDQKQIGSPCSSWVARYLSPQELPARSGCPKIEIELPLSRKMILNLFWKNQVQKLVSELILNGPWGPRGPLGPRGPRGPRGPWDPWGPWGPTFLN